MKYRITKTRKEIGVVQITADIPDTKQLRKDFKSLGYKLSKLPASSASDQ